MSQVALSAHFQIDNKSRVLARDDVGAKALGLFALPIDWTPPFFCLFSSAWTPRAADSDPDALESLSTYTAREVAKRIGDIRRLGFDRLAVRSSASTETLEDRGLYESRICKANRNEVVAAALLIRSQAQEAAKNRLQKAPAMALVVQGFIESRAAGHISNERRVSKYIHNWMIEVEEWKGLQLRSYRARIAASDVSAPESPLLCGDAERLDECLKQIATAFTRKRARVHLEWIWDGSRIWIVQCDRDTDRKVDRRPGTPPLGWRISEMPKRFKVLVPAERATGHWAKAECISIFRECGLHPGDVLQLKGEDVLRDLSVGIVSKNLISDLTALISSRVVIRTDTEKSKGHQKLLLPRTDSISTIEEAASFMQRNLHDLERQGIPFADISFLLHRLIPARAGAYAFAKPSIPHVLIDCTWGSPDGLNYFAHDSFQVDARNSRVIRRKVRCKTTYIDLNDEGLWIEIQNGRPWDWNPSASDEQLIAIAQATARIADRVGREVAVMFFVGVDDRSGLPDCLPWFISPEVSPDVDRDSVGIRLSGKRVLVEGERDLALFESSADATQLPHNIRLKPIPDLLRSREFLQQVAVVAKRTNSAVELEGSVLSHAYYVLRREGVRIRTVEPLSEPVVRRRFGKLVRDLVPLRIVSHGEDARSVRVSKVELISLLKAKAVEESLEFLWESNSDLMLEELADLLEVIDSYCRVAGKTRRGLNDIVKRKKKERGGFDQGVVLVETRAVPLLTRDSKQSALFNDSDDASGIILQKSGTALRRILQLRRPHLRNSEVTLPLVPPDRGMSDFFVLRIPDTNIELHIQYEQTAIRVQIRESRSSLKNDPRQRLLGFMESDLV